MMERLKELRKDRKLRQLDVAKSLSLSSQVYSNYENGTREPSQDTLIKLADFYGVSIDYLLGRDTAPQGVTIIRATEELTPVERELLTRFRSLKEHSKARLLAYLDGMEAEAKNSKYNRT